MGRRDRDDLGDPRDARRDRVHEHRRRIEGEPAGDVDADAPERPDLLAELDPEPVAVAKGALDLTAVVVADAPRGEPESTEVRRRQARGRSAHLLRADAPARGSEGHVVEAPGRRRDRTIATTPYVLDHGANDRLDRGVEIEAAPLEPRADSSEARLVRPHEQLQPGSFSSSTAGP